MVFGIGRGKQRPQKLIRPGRHVRIIGNVGVCDDDDPGCSLELKGEEGVLVEGGNMTYLDEKTNEIKQLMQLDDGGGLVGVPARQLKEIRKRHH